jgi:hypothetical protein
MLPGAYERWFAEMSGRSSPVESRATCDDCAMLPGAPDLPPEGPFEPEVRCCTYHPHLAAHLVGGILRTGNESGRERVRARIAARVGVTPLGITPAPDYSRRYQRLAALPGAFGRNRELVCPFLQDARCTIWRHRGVACAAFHCKLDRGSLGQWRWNLIVVAFNVVDRVLSRWLLEKQGLDVAACDALLHHPDDASLAAPAWGGFQGREEPYFLEAAQLIEPLSWAEIVALGGRELVELGEAMRGALARVDAVPERVRRGPDVLHHIGRAGSVRLQHPGVPFDLLEVPGEVSERLARLDEAPLADLGLPVELARRLLDWQVLVGA